MWRKRQHAAGEDGDQQRTPHAANILILKYARDMAGISGSAGSLSLFCWREGLPLLERRTVMPTSGGRRLQGELELTSMARVVEPVVHGLPHRHDLERLLGRHGRPGRRGSGFHGLCGLCLENAKLTTSTTSPVSFSSLQTALRVSPQTAPDMGRPHSIACIAIRAAQHRTH